MLVPMWVSKVAGINLNSPPVKPLIPLRTCCKMLCWYLCGSPRLLGCLSLFLITIPYHYSLFIYIPAPRLHRTDPTVIGTPPSETPNSAADVLQNAHLKSTWDLKGRFIAFCSHQCWFRGGPEARFGVPDVCLGLQDVPDAAKMGSSWIQFAI